MKNVAPTAEQHLRHDIDPGDLKSALDTANACLDRITQIVMQLHPTMEDDGRPLNDAERDQLLGDFSRDAHELRGLLDMISPVAGPREVQ